ncbi:DUF6882 domain-containing protein [Mesorhizobium sp. ES1-1]|uniref:DUF6882 domain-containing protein n=1 Tax=Mesorhizobium sp. ES1-1 TaxID=2876629 RepID=UPI001CCCB829|nr:DUF6882 domain-containing protein [Mesorhizobium sp. ES1-1]MBZ9677782.1 hypothetical protein [Mesorhizobium sp. ES1-1]
MKVIAEIQIAGTASARAGNWLWAWANSDLPDRLISDAKQVRSFGEMNSIDELAQSYVTDEDDQLESLGWELSAVMSRICGGLRIYRCPDSHGGLYLMFKSIGWAK